MKGLTAASALAIGLVPMAAAGLLAAAPAGATTFDEAKAICTAELTGQAGAREVRDLDVARRDGKPHVYGNADFDDATGVHFVCKVFHERVIGLHYLVPDPSRAGGKRWANARPHGTAHEGLQLDAAARASVPLDAAVPKTVDAPPAEAPADAPATGVVEGASPPATGSQVPETKNVPAEGAPRLAPTPDATTGGGAKTIRVQ